MHLNYSSPALSFSNCKSSYTAFHHSACVSGNPCRQRLRRLRHLSFPLTRISRSKIIFACRAAVKASQNNARQCIEEGLEKFQAGAHGDAAKFFERALELDPKPEEAQAALYNLACSQTKLMAWQQAASSVAEAVNTYSLKLDVALKDKDLAPLRERREWRDAVERMSGSLSARNLINVRAEQKAPFRLFRLIFAGGLGTGALVGLLIIFARLARALQGGEDAPDLNETLKNLAINGIAVAVLGTILAWDLRKQKSDKSVIEREEELARLQVRMGADRVITMETLRGAVRPVVVIGSKGQVARSIKAAAPLKEALHSRGICAVALVLSQEDPEAKLAALKAEFRPEKGFAKSPKQAPVVGNTGNKAAGQAGRQFELEPYNVAEWSAWLEALKKEAKVSGSQLYIQVQLDGSVRSSALGSPPWQRFCEDLPVLDSLRTRLSDGLRQ